MTACSSTIDARRPSLRYGKEAVTLDLSAAASVTYLYGSQMPVVNDLEAAFRNGVEEGAYGLSLIHI